MTTEHISKVCPKHKVPIKTDPEHGEYCPECLYSSFLTHQAQNAAVRRHNQTDKHKSSEKTYEKSAKGKEARQRYLKSDKYKEARKAYNQRLNESLRIARQAEGERAKALTTVEVRRIKENAELIEDIREYFDNRNKAPTTSVVIKWANDSYNIALTSTQAEALIARALNRRGK